MAPIVRALRKAYGTFTALHGIDLDIEEGEVVCVVGPTGSGKSTLIRRINLLEDFAHGADDMPYKGLEVTGRPVIEVACGRISVRDGEVKVGPGAGEDLRRQRSGLIPERGAAVLPSTDGQGRKA